jgi:uncharacterized protein YdaU (DUF1376 family)
MSERPFMQLYVSDFIGDTLHLSTEQIGAYMLLLMAMWNAGGQLPADEAKLARVVRMSVKKWRTVSTDLMAFFDSDGTHVQHNRLTKELQKSESKSQSRASAGAAGGAAKALKDKEARLANAMPEPQHLPDTITREEKREAKASPKARPTRIPDGFVPNLIWAEQQGMTPQQAEAEAAKFRDYWASKGSNATKTDWDATWRNWVRGALERLPQARGSPAPKPRTTQDVATDLLRKMEAADASTDQEIERGSPAPLRIPSYG